MRLLTPEELAHALHRPRPLANSLELLRDLDFSKSIVLYSTPLLAPPIYLGVVGRGVLMLDLSKGRSLYISIAASQEEAPAVLDALSPEEVAYHQHKLNQLKPYVDLNN